MNTMIITIIALVVGVMITGAGIYYLIQEKNDEESKKIYGITTVIGILICIGVIIKMINII